MKAYCFLTAGRCAQGLYPQATNGASDGQIHVGADDMTTVFVNGDRVGETG